MKSLYEKALELEIHETKMRDDLFKIMIKSVIDAPYEDRYKGFQPDDEGRIWPDVAAKTWQCVDDMMEERKHKLEI